jgi:endonuclease III
MSKKEAVQRLVKERGTMFSEELKIDLAKDTPSPLFRWLTFSLLASTRISWQKAMDAAEALRKEGLTSPGKMADATWRERTDILNRSGYARYDESTSRMLQDASDLLLEKYNGDLRKLRDAADQDPERERQLLKEVKGVGDVGVDIFAREAQTAWDEWRPFADKRAIESAKRLDLGDDASDLERLVSKKDYPRLVAALVRTELAGDHDRFKG